MLVIDSPPKQFPPILILTYYMKISRRCPVGILKIMEVKNGWVRLKSVAR